MWDNVISPGQILGLQALYYWTACILYGVVSISPCFKGETLPNEQTYQCSVRCIAVKGLLLEQKCVAPFTVMCSGLDTPYNGVGAV